MFLTSIAFAQPGGGGGGGRSGGGGHGSNGGRSSPPPARGGSPSSPSNSAPPPPRSSSSDSSSSNGRLSTQAFNGMRLSKNHEPFQVVLIESTKTSIFVTFNIPLNPISLKWKNILINGNALDKTSEIKFNKTGRTLEIKTNLMVGTKFTLEFKNVKSYDNESLTVTKFTSLLPWTSQEYPSIKSTETEERQ